MDIEIAKQCNDQFPAEDNLLCSSNLWLSSCKKRLPPDESWHKQQGYNGLRFEKYLYHEKDIDVCAYLQSNINLNADIAYE